MLHRQEAPGRQGTTGLSAPLPGMLCLGYLHGPVPLVIQVTASKKSSLITISLLILSPLPGFIFP